jgi:hypothetical protein
MLAPSIVQAEVTVVINSEEFVFSDNPRLTEVLTPVAQKRHWYWPGSALFRLDGVRAVQQRREVLASLTVIEQETNVALANNIQHLKLQIQTWQLADRIEQTIDFDLARLDPNFNPRFEDGSYLLILKERPKTIEVFGLTENPTTLRLEHGTCLAKQLHKTYSDLQNKDLIYITQADSTVINYGIAYWNKSCVDVMPGSQIFLPFAESQFSESNRKLNYTIASLAKNRVTQ